ncbi:carbohydrate ABC transporter permease [Vibrio sp. E150_011]
MSTSNSLFRRRLNRSSVFTRLNRGQWLVTILMSLITIPVILPYFWMFFVSFTAGDTGSVNVSAIGEILSVFIPVLIATFITLFAIEDARLRRVIYGSLFIVLVLNIIVRAGNDISFDSYRFLADGNTTPSLFEALNNSLLLAGGQTVLVCSIATMAGYYLSRFNFTGRAAYMKGLVMLHAFPALTLIIPIFLLLHWSNLLDSLFGVVLVTTAIELPFAIFLMKGFFDNVSWDIEMSAMTDGASRIQAFFAVVLPQVKNGVIAIGVFSFLKGWEEYIFVTSFIFDSNHWVMSQFLYFYAEDSMGADYGLLTAVAVVYLIPSIVLYITCQKYLSQISVGGTKG